MRTMLNSFSWRLRFRFSLLALLATVVFVLTTSETSNTNVQDDLSDPYYGQ